MKIVLWPFFAFDRLALRLTRWTLDLVYDWLDVTAQECFALMIALWSSLLAIGMVRTASSFYFLVLAAVFVAFVLVWGALLIFGALRLGVVAFRSGPVMRVCYGVLLVLSSHPVDFSFFGNLALWCAVYVAAASEKPPRPPGRKRKRALDWLKNLGRPRPVVIDPVPA